MPVTVCSSKLVRLQSYDQYWELCAEGKHVPRDYQERSEGKAERTAGIGWENGQHWVRFAPWPGSDYESLSNVSEVRDPERLGTKYSLSTGTKSIPIMHGIKARTLEVRDYHRIGWLRGKNWEIHITGYVENECYRLGKCVSSLESR